MYKVERLFFPELVPSLESFAERHPDPSRCGFLMMQYGATKAHDAILDALKDAADQKRIELIRADDERYSDDLLANIRVLMHGCSFGVAVFERLENDDFNPNVSLEVGYMLALKKPVCLLKDTTLRALQTDLVGRLYESFDTRNLQETLPKALHDWLRKKSIIPE